MTSLKPVWKETDLYPPLKSWLEGEGYTVHGEVEHCDVAARRGQELVLVEIKKTINLELLLQLVRRQEASVKVYAAVPAPKITTGRWSEMTRLLKRLAVGLIVVHMGRTQPLVQVAFHPSDPKPRCRASRTKAMLREMDHRGVDINLGGSSRVKIFTAYRLAALDVVQALIILKQASPGQLRTRGTSPKTGSILRDNHYGWFEKVARATYRLSEAGYQASSEYQGILGVDELSISRSDSLTGC